ncbi:MAG: hypothetical protein H6Q00_846 [Holophagaceae bacterium]|nr:hypothetical protein [Holophagaceae bacterium]
MTWQVNPKEPMTTRSIFVPNCPLVREAVRSLIQIGQMVLTVVARG